MNTENQNKQWGEQNIDVIGRQLHELGDRIERLAEKLKQSGQETEGEELYQLGDQVEHFCDMLKSKSGAEVSRDSSSTVNSNQSSS